MNINIYPNANGEQKTLPTERRPALFSVAKGEGEQPY